MKTFPVEAVGRRIAKGAKLPTSNEIFRILTELWSIFPEGTAVCDWEPAGEFNFRKRENKSDRPFRIRDFEGRNERAEGDGNPGRAGIDLLGKYTLRNSAVTIYVDSCRKAARRYDVSLEELIKVVLVHELAHLMTHQGLPLESTYGKESDHLWEYAAQCATMLTSRHRVIMKLSMSFSDYHLTNRSSTGRGRD
jgi:hypothetical protein